MIFRWMQMDSICIDNGTNKGNRERKEEKREREWVRKRRKKIKRREYSKVNLNWPAETTDKTERIFYRGTERRGVRDREERRQRKKKEGDSKKSWVRERLRARAKKNCVRERWFNHHGTQCDKKEACTLGRGESSVSASKCASPLFVYCAHLVELITRTHVFTFYISNTPTLELHSPPSPSPSPAYSHSSIHPSMDFSRKLLSTLTGSHTNTQEQQSRVSAPLQAETRLSVHNIYPAIYLLLLLLSSHVIITY